VCGRCVDLRNGILHVLYVIDLPFGLCKAVVCNLGVVCLFLGVARASDKTILDIIFRIWNHILS